MNSHYVKWLLFAVICIMAIGPMIATMHFFNRSLQTSLDLGFNQSVVTILEQSANNLKKLNSFDQNNSSIYKEQFEEIEELLHIYTQPELIKSHLSGSLTTYFLLGVLGTVFISLIIAFLLSKRISSAYNAMFAKMLYQKEKLTYLENMASWQRVARMLAHEIKNPLTPISVLVSSLNRGFQNKSRDAFRLQLNETERVVNDELEQLNNIVNRFSEFSKVPKVDAHVTDASAVFQEMVNKAKFIYDVSTLHFKNNLTDRELSVRLDVPLMRQVMSNIINNALEANKGKNINITVKLTYEHGNCVIYIINDGTPVDGNVADRLFEPYISTHKSNHNLGLGLAIAKLIVVEHGGDIAHQFKDGLTMFVIQLPGTLK